MRAFELERVTGRSDDLRQGCERACRPSFAGGLPTELRCFPAECGCAGGERQGEVERSVRVIEDDVVLRQPVEPGVRADHDVDALPREAAVRLVPLRRAWGGPNGVCVRAECDLDGEPIAARDAAGRVNDDRMTDRVAFRVERALYAQRTVMQPMRECRARPVLLEAEFEPGKPFVVCDGGGLCEGCGLFVKRHGRFASRAP